MRYALILLYLVICLAVSSCADTPETRSASVRIGVNVPMYPQLILVPDSPVYYDPRARANYFFYDGLYWVFTSDNWYASAWYDGPWDLVRREYVPLYILRVPVRYYRQPPTYFHGWQADAPPRWDERWGQDWDRRQTGVDQREHRPAPEPAPLPAYQRQYSGERYPREAEQQRSIRSENYHYQPREAVTQERYKQQDKRRVRRVDERGKDRW